METALLPRIADTSILYIEVEIYLTYKSMVDAWSSKVSSDLNFTRRPRSRILERALTKLRNELTLRDKGDWTPLHCAAHLGNEKITRILLQNGADVDSINNDGFTPLHLACHKNNQRCIRAILEYGPQLNTGNPEVNTPLNIFLRYFSHGEKLLKMFLDGGANPNTPNSEDGFTPLHYVALGNGKFTKKAEIFARILIDYKADVNFKNRAGDTPLHIAVGSGVEALVPIFLENNADISIKNESGHSPMDIALCSNEKWMENILDHLGEHLISRLCFKLLVNQNNFESVCGIERLRNFKDKCELELVKLKKNYIGSSSVTCYDILISSPDRVANYLRNADILRSMMDFNSRKYTIFGGKLIQNFHEGLKRRYAFDVGYKFCFKVFPVDLPANCLDQIIENLSNEDLENLEGIIPY